jgi:hypothetical protein
MIGPGDVAATSDEVDPWLVPWTRDPAYGATVAEVLGMLLDASSSPLRRRSSISAKPCGPSAAS